jgi:hypothetical protein
MPYGSSEPDADVITTDHFLLEIDGVACTAFEQVNVPDVERALVENRTGEDGDEIITTPGRKTAQEFTFRKRCREGGAEDLQVFYDAVDDKRRMDGAVILRDASGLELKRWTFSRGLLYKISPQNPLDANVTDQPFELEMTMRVQRVKVS